MNRKAMGEISIPLCGFFRGRRQLSRFDHPEICLIILTFAPHDKTDIGYCVVNSLTPNLGVSRLSPSFHPRKHFLF